MAEFRGSYTVAYTPFTEGGAAIDHEGLRRFIDWQIEEGMHGLIALASVGQFLSITDEERTAIVETFVGQAAGRVPVLVSTMDASTDNAVRYSKEAEALGADVSGASDGDAANILADRIIYFMKALKIPNGLSAIGYTEEDIPALVQGTLPQHRVTKLSPKPADEADLTALFKDAMRYW